MINLPKITQRKKKRVGRGYGSGKGGHTAGRGQKGQRSRGKIALTFAGTKIKKSLLKRLPFLRGKGKFSPRKNKPFGLNLKYLNLLPGDEVVNLEVLIKAGIVSEEARVYGVKILGEGNLEKPLKIALPVSRGALAKIQKARGEILDKEEEAKKDRRRKN